MMTKIAGLNASGKRLTEFNLAHWTACRFGMEVKSPPDLKAIYPGWVTHIEVQAVDPCEAHVPVYIGTMDEPIRVAEGDIFAPVIRISLTPLCGRMPTPHD